MSGSAPSEEQIDARVCELKARHATHFRIHKLHTRIESCEHEITAILSLFATKIAAVSNDERVLVLSDADFVREVDRQRAELVVKRDALIEVEKERALRARAEIQLLGGGGDIGRTLSPLERSQVNLNNMLGVTLSRIGERLKIVDAMLDDPDTSPSPNCSVQ